MTNICEMLIEFLKSWSSFRLVRIPVQYLCSFITAIYFRLVERISKFLNALGFIKCMLPRLVRIRLVRTFF